MDISARWAGVYRMAVNWLRTGKGRKGFLLIGIDNEIKWLDGM